MADVKTVPTIDSVDAFLDAVEDPQRRTDARTVCAAMQRLTGEPPVMWGPSIIGFGSYHYRYASGHEGDMCRIGFSPRKTELVLYLQPGSQHFEELLTLLGKHRVGKSCLYIKRLSDIDREVLEEMMVQSLAEMERLYPSI
ncbi:DUF1801 domain-containing protein [Sphingomonas japonica]|uniref:YdhG-like domain-containing protein n=1 Tax=Sphingomonas japonica TaxID=511662 RepID=A0ABX0U3V1_9SPHN|nr:DUF1801 domain-containing protein [Sphingomonas japonica]NIJ24056.1 hypothetical protein [Sphingomonas japonica]